MKLPEPYRACSCRDPETGRLLGNSCPGLERHGHGGWYARYEAPRGADYRNVASMMAKVAAAAAEMQRAMRVMVLGIDYWQFERFRRLTPAIAYYIDGHQERRPPRDYAPTADEFGICRDFIVTAALRVAEHQA